MTSRIDLNEIAERVTIPTLPEVVTKLNSMVEDPRVGLDEIGDVVAQDAAISAKVLRIANSAVYGLAEPAGSVVDAAKVVGARTLRNIAMQASIFNHYDAFKDVKDFNLYGVWKHAIFVGQLAQELATRTPGVTDEMAPDEFYTCGLLHDLGKVVLLESLGEEYVSVYREARESGRASHLVEQDRYGFSHTDVGVVVAQRWELHERIARVLQHHHGPRFEIESDPIIAVVAVADQLAYRFETGEFAKYARKLAADSTQLLKISTGEFSEVVDWGAEILPLIEI